MNQIAIHGFLFLSAFAPAMIFITLAVDKYTHVPALGNRGLETHVRKHFQYIKNRDITLRRGNEQLTGYFEVYPNGEYFFYLPDHTEVMRLKKDHTGWSLLGISGQDESKHKFVMPLILQLESKLFN